MSTEASSHCDTASLTCVQCGRRLPDNTRYCPMCGTSISVSTTTVPCLEPPVATTASGGAFPAEWNIVAPTGSIPSGTVVIQRGLLDASHISGDCSFTPALNAYLEVSGSEGVPLVLATEQETFVIGRDRQVCNAIVEDPRISRRHLVIGVTENGPYVEDLGSTNGTFVNGERREGRVELHDGDVLRFGRTEATFRMAPA